MPSKKIIVKDIPKLIKTKKGRFIKYRKRRIPVNSNKADSKIYKLMIKFFNEYVKKNISKVQDMPITATAKTNELSKASEGYLSQLQSSNPKVFGSDVNITQKLEKQREDALKAKEKESEDALKAKEKDREDILKAREREREDRERERENAFIAREKQINELAIVKYEAKAAENNQKLALLSYELKTEADTKKQKKDYNDEIDRVQKLFIENLFDLENELNIKLAKSNYAISSYGQQLMLEQQKNAYELEKQNNIINELNNAKTSLETLGILRDISREPEINKITIHPDSSDYALYNATPSNPYFESFDKNILKKPVTKLSSNNSYYESYGVELPKTQTPSKPSSSRAVKPEPKSSSESPAAKQERNPKRIPVELPKFEPVVKPAAKLAVKPIPKPKQVISINRPEYVQNKINNSDITELRRLYTVLDPTDSKNVNLKGSRLPSQHIKGYINKLLAEDPDNVNKLYAKLSGTQVELFNEPEPVVVAKGKKIPIVAEEEEYEDLPELEIKPDQIAPLAAENIAINPALAEGYIPSVPPIIPDQAASGDKKHRGLFNTEVTHLMRDYPHFKGTLAVDMIDKLPITAKDKIISFVMNTAPHNISEGHFIAVYINGDTVEFFDPLVEEPSKMFYKHLKLLMNKLKSNNKLYQFKINTVKKQSNTSDNCAYFAAKFLKDRFEGKSFKDATGFKIIEDSIKGEKEIEQFKKLVKQFDNVKFIQSGDGLRCSTANRNDGSRYVFCSNTTRRKIHKIIHPIEKEIIIPEPIKHSQEYLNLPKILNNKEENIIKKIINKVKEKSINKDLEFIYFSSEQGCYDSVRIGDMTRDECLNKIKNKYIKLKKEFNSGLIRSEFIKNYKKYDINTFNHATNSVENFIYWYPRYIRAYEDEPENEMKLFEKFTNWFYEYLSVQSKRENQQKIQIRR